MNEFIKEGRTVDAGQCADELLQLRTKVAKLELLGISNIDRDAVIEECANLCESIWPNDNQSGHEWTDGFIDGICDCADAIRAIKSQPAQPDPRDKALKLAEDAIKDLRSGLFYIRQTHGALYGIELDRAESKAYKALAAIDALIGDN